MKEKVSLHPCMDVHSHPFKGKMEWKRTIVMIEHLVFYDLYRTYVHAQTKPHRLQITLPHTQENNLHTVQHIHKTDFPMVTTRYSETENALLGQYVRTYFPQM